MASGWVHSVVAEVPEGQRPNVSDLWSELADALAASRSGGSEDLALVVWKQSVLQRFGEWARPVHWSGLPDLRPEELRRGERAAGSAPNECVRGAEPAAQEVSPGDSSPVAITGNSAGLRAGRRGFSGVPRRPVERPSTKGSQ